MESKRMRIKCPQCKIEGFILLPYYYYNGETECPQCGYIGPTWTLRNHRTGIKTQKRFEEED